MNNSRDLKVQYNFFKKNILVIQLNAPKLPSINYEITSIALGSYVASCRTWTYKLEGGGVLFYMKLITKWREGVAVLHEIDHKISFTPSVLKTSTGWNVGHIVLQTDIANTTSK